MAAMQWGDVALANAANALGLFWKHAHRKIRGTGYTCPQVRRSSIHVTNPDTI